MPQLASPYASRVLEITLESGTGLNRALQLGTGLCGDPSAVQCVQGPPGIWC